MATQTKTEKKARKSRRKSVRLTDEQVGAVRTALERKAETFDTVDTAALPDEVVKVLATKREEYADLIKTLDANGARVTVSIPTNSKAAE